MGLMMKLKNKFKYHVEEYTYTNIIKLLIAHYRKILHSENIQTQKSKGVLLDFLLVLFITFSWQFRNEYNELQLCFMRKTL